MYTAAEDENYCEENIRLDMYMQVSQICAWEEATEFNSGSYFSSEHQKANFRLDRESWQLSQIIIEGRFKHFEKMLLEDRGINVIYTFCFFHLGISIYFLFSSKGVLFLQ